MNVLTHYRIIAISLLFAGVLSIPLFLVNGLLLGGFASDSGNSTIFYVVFGGTMLIGLLFFIIPPIAIAIGLLQRRFASRKFALKYVSFLCFLLPFLPFGLYMRYVMCKRDPDGSYFVNAPEKMVQK